MNEKEVRWHYLQGRNLAIFIVFVVTSLTLLSHAILNSIEITEVLNNDRKDQSEDQTASLLLDALSGYDMPFATDIKVVNSSTEDDGEEGCPEGYEHLFQNVWLGVEEGCVYDQLVMSAA